MEGIVFTRFRARRKKLEAITNESKWQNRIKELAQSFHSYLNLQSTQMVSFIKNLDVCEEFTTFTFFGDIKKIKELQQYVKKYYLKSSTLIYKEDPKELLNKTFGDVNGYDDMVVQKNISVQSHCEHHMAPIIGVAHVAYIPKDRVVGLSKLARVVEVFSKRLQTQERLTMQIANTLMQSLDAKGVAVTIDSTHQCMTMRGIKKEQASTVTNYYLGQFKEDLSYQNRYRRFIRISKD